MLSSVYVEDIFLNFYHLAEQRVFPVQRLDMGPITSFYVALTSGNLLTENQAKFILIILQKYRNLSQLADLDYFDAIDKPQWKHPFRVVDYSKKVFVEVDENNKIWICMKFPYQLKKTVDDVICGGSSTHNNSIWDHENKMRKFAISDFNAIHIHEFALIHNFEMDETFISLIADIEEIWQNQETIIPQADVINGKVVLINATPDAQQYWELNSTNSINSDILLAKSMGFRLGKSPENIIERIGHSGSNSFWIKTNLEFLSICKNINGKICVVLDRVGRTQEWLTEFANDIDRAGIPRTDVKVCFRANKDETPNLNQWIKDQGFGGKVEDGKILIFNHKPAKWLFKESNSVKILASNNLYPSTNQLSRDWFQSHPCVIYIGDIKPSQSKEQQIVDL
jgi:hypothetical protein